MTVSYKCVFLAALALTVAAQSSLAQSPSDSVDATTPSEARYESNLLRPDPVIASNVFGREVKHPIAKPGNSRALWIVSSVVLVAASAADLGSSLGHNEANPTMQNAAGRFSAGKAVGIKMSLSGATLLVQSLFGRRNASTYRSSAILNFIGAGVMGGVAAHNASIR